MQTTTVGIDGRDHTVHEGGDGEVFLLLHGGWGGAESHWARVWAPLARRGRVVAPELPGVMDGDPHVWVAPEWASWVERLLDAMGVTKAWVVGNSLGAAIAWGFASRHPARVHGLVLVDGEGGLSHGPVARAALALPGARAVLRAMMRFNTYSPKTLELGFARPAHAPPEVVRTLTHPDPPQLDRMLTFWLSGDPDAPPPRVPACVIWGAEDRLIGLGPRLGRRVAARLGAELTLIAGAGHLPQWEQPDAFVAAIDHFVGAVRVYSGADVR